MNMRFRAGRCRFHAYETPPPHLVYDVLPVECFQTVYTSKTPRRKSCQYGLSSTLNPKPQTLNPNLASSAATDSRLYGSSKTLSWARPMSLARKDYLNACGECEEGLKTLQLLRPCIVVISTTYVYACTCQAS